MIDSRELTPNPEIASRLALDIEFQGYVPGRSYTYEELVQPWQSGDKDEWGMNRLESNYSLLEDVNTDSDRQFVEPDITVCMPVAILREDDSTTLKGLTALRKAYDKYGKNIDVIVWANAKMDDEGSLKSEAEARYADLKEKISELDSNGFRVRTALQLLPKSQATMSNVRANFMDAVAMDGHTRGFTFEHPVMWLDADTTFVAGIGLEPLIKKVQSMESLFVHANLQHSVDWAEGVAIKDLDDTTRAIVVHEVARRINILGAGDRMTMGYVEECGLAFALGTYLWAGGVSLLKPTDESYTLMERAKHRLKYEDGLPKYAVENKLKFRTPEIITRVPSLRVGMSARRLNVAARVDGIMALNSLGRNYREDLGLFTDIEPSEATKAQPSVSRKDMDNLLRVDRRRFNDGIHYSDKSERWWQARNRIAIRLIDRYFSDSEDN